MNRLVEKRDLAQLAVLLLLGLGIGTYLIATSVVIAKDGVLYIEKARIFSTNPISVIRADPPFGYPFLIFIAHKLVSLFGESSSVYSWIYPAQSVTLLCRLLSLIPLYFIGKLLVGSDKSFWAILILVMLPRPAEFGSDVLRDWPHIFFLACGFWAILYGAEKRKWWAFGLAGFCAGLGYLVRPVCVQLVAYGTVWLVYCFLKPAKTMTRTKTVPAMVLLLSGFLAVAIPYTKVKGTILPPKVKGLMNSCAGGDRFHAMQEWNPSAGGDRLPKHVEVRANVFVDALYGICKDVGENLMWVFMVPWLIGVFHHFRSKEANAGKFLLSLFIGVNVLLLFLRSTHFDKAMSKRYVLPLIAFTIFYVPAGLEILADKLSGLRPGKVRSRDQRWFYVLIVIGVGICLPKLFRPIGIDKGGYKDAAKWLRENAAADAIVAVPDRRILFYAQRKGPVYGVKLPGRADYIMTITDKEKEEPDFGGAVQKEYSVWVNKRKLRGRKLVIYRAL
ncbi:MAG: ArnT family glycosyltransferase [Planctomycetota bacterium]